jgi:hypothetical protein
MRAAMADPENNGGFAPPHPNGAAQHPRASHAQVLRRRIFLIAGIVIVAAWIFAIIWSVTVTSSSPERLDKVDAAAVSATCNDARARLLALPNPSPRLGADRVARVRAEDAVLRTMLDRLGDIHPRDKTPATALTGWTRDWARVIEARERYAGDLEAAKDTDKTVKFIVPADTGVKPITGKMDDFVRESHPDLDACFTRALELETVEGERTYEKVTS